ncbi:hypothetical protein LCGC14_2167460, partial [marine sediment metagenome]
GMILYNSLVIARSRDACPNPTEAQINKIFLFTIQNTLKFKIAHNKYSYNTVIIIY